MTIDTTFDFRDDSFGKDPDTHSPTLRRYHKLLWSKPLPNGRLFELDDTARGAYLHHKSDLGEFFLASDSCIPTFALWARMRHIIDQMPPEEVVAFGRTAYTIGGMMVFPGNSVDGKQTINGARGFNSRIADRLDLTLESIRRHYLGEWSPLQAVLARYDEFFRLFGDFRGYVDFFLLQDLVTDEGAVKLLMPFDDFATPAVPRSLDEYLEYRRLTLEFLDARNDRIAALYP
jgi:hypothetical protein